MSMKQVHDNKYAQISQHNQTSLWENNLVLDFNDVLAES